MMGKRSTFERRKNDAYDTPYSAIVPLLPLLAKSTRYIEPCAGDGAIVRHLQSHGHVCVEAIDIDPRADFISHGDATTLRISNADCFITNPPWTRELLHPIIMNLSAQFPTWLLFDADWAHTKQAVPYMRFCRKIVSVGRVKWIPDSPFSGKDNCAWYLFTADSDAPAEFVARAA